MSTLSVTLNEFMRRNPGKEYPQDRLAELWSGCDRMTALDMLACGLPTCDLLWVVLHESLIPARLLHTFACNEAELLLRAERLAGREPNPRSWAAIEAKRAWLRGEITDSELAIARAAAWAATGDAWATTRATAGVAWVVARDAETAARDATRDAADKDAQLTRLRTLLAPRCHECGSVDVIRDGDTCRDCRNRTDGHGQYEGWDSPDVPDDDDDN